MGSDGDPGRDLGARLEELGRSLGERESAHAEALEAARAKARALRDTVEAALDRFHAGASKGGADHLKIALGALRTDDKHLRAIEFNLVRGRHKAVVVAKARGDVTLVGPFHIGKNEGPCKSFPMESESELQHALGEFLARFVEEAAAP